ncbi:ribonuclease Z [Paenibacillus sp. GCM10027627]|uniref:ribonuclease Z n=1 Tax=unclassified Paenibacillus TaxID=185978 RepID=UPI003625E8BF
MKMWFLGTGAGRPNKHRNVTAMALQLPEPMPGWWLFDAGEGTQHQLMKLPLKFSKLEAIFITHLHGDHLYGLPGLLSSRSFDGGVTPVTVYGPIGLKKYIETTFELTGTFLDYELNIQELPEEPTVVMDNGRLKITAMPLQHRVPCFGYRVEEADMPGKLQADKLRALGVKEGPLFGKLKNGESVVLADGRTISPEMVTDGVTRGRVVAVLGDTSPCDAVLELGKDADLLIHEATFATGMEEKAHEFGHSTTVEAALAASKSGAKQLAMTHFSGRYGNEELILLTEEAQSVFPDTLAAQDLMMVEIKRRHP